jgi:hypothetical protein
VVVVVVGGDDDRGVEVSHHYLILQLYIIPNRTISSSSFGYIYQRVAAPGSPGRVRTWSIRSIHGAGVVADVMELEMPDQGHGPLKLDRTLLAH